MATSGGGDVTGFQGADTEALRQIGGTVGGGAARLDALAVRLGALLEAVTWVGPDADALRADWSAHVRPELGRGADRLREDAQALHAHAEEQDASSAADGTDGVPAGVTSPSEPLPVGDRADRSAAQVSRTLGARETLAVQDIALTSHGVPLAGSAAEASEALGESPLAFTGTGMELSPPETGSTVTVDEDHALAPDGADEPFGRDADGEPLRLAPGTAYEVGEHGTFVTDEEGRVVHVEATGGGEQMNPNLREVFPDATYHVNESTYYRTDELGRTEHMYVPEVIVDREMRRSQSIQSTIAERWDMAGDGTSEPVEFNAGHVLARQLGGIREEINYTRQWDEVNQARSGQDTIYTFEDLMADGITEDGSSYSYETLVTWGEEQPAGVGPEHDSEPWEYVPESYDVRLTEDGEQIVDAHLSNYPEGARFPD